MFGTMRKHSTALWTIIIAVVIVSFVFFFSPYAKMQGQRRAANNFGSINGQPVDEEEFRQTAREVYLRYLINTGEWPDAKNQNYDVTREAYYRLLVIRKQQEMGIEVGD